MPKICLLLNTYIWLSCPLLPYIEIEKKLPNPCNLFLLNPFVTDNNNIFMIIFIVYMLMYYIFHSHMYLTNDNKTEPYSPHNILLIYLFEAFMLFLQIIANNWNIKDIIRDYMRSAIKNAIVTVLITYYVAII